MEKEHTKSVVKVLKKISFDKPFTFLDVGCGNGWVVRIVSNELNCKKSIGIDKSKNMVIEAKKSKSNKNEKYIVSDIENFIYPQKFDYIFSMESLYYVDSFEKALKKIIRLLKPGGEFFCGTDFYKENKETSKWAKMMNVPMHLYSKKEWKCKFETVGFKTKTIHIKDLKNTKKWRREFGTLFIIGKKPG
jgi:ubiquinone/menaquinone biosynthesis C-methylase UbiE